MQTPSDEAVKKIVVFWVFLNNHLNFHFPDFEITFLYATEMEQGCKESIWL